MKTIVVAVVAVAGSGWGVSTVLDAGTPVDETLPAAAEGVVTVRIPAGTVSLKGWDRPEIRVSGDLADPDALRIRSNPGHVEIRVSSDAGAESDDGLRLTIKLPRASSIDAETDRGDIDVTGVEGMVRLESGSGNLVIAGDPAGVVATSRSGDIDIRAPNVRGIVHSEDGAVRLRGAASGTIVARRGAARHRQSVGGTSTPDEQRLHALDCRARRELRARLDRQMERIRAEAARRRSAAFCCSDEHEERVHRATGDLGAAIARIVRESAWAIEGVQDLVESDRWNGGVEINIADAVGVEVDIAALEEMLETMGEEIEKQMEALAEEFDERYRDYAEEFRRDSKRSGRRHR